MVKWYIGTMGFGWKDWQGSFYPAGTPASNQLAHYSRVFNAVEIDSTFYGTPRQSSLQRWAGQTPQGFKICAKVPRRITHELSLASAGGEMEAFLEAMQALGEKLGAVLLQLPPSFGAERAPQLEDFLAALPEGARLAVEFRNQSWYTPKTAQLLASRRVCWAATEYAGLPRQVEVTAGFLYVRFIGQHGRFPRHHREQADVSASLEWWRQRLLSLLERADTVFGFFNNDYAGHAPASARRFMEMIGLRAGEQSPPRQERLL